MAYPSGMQGLSVEERFWAKVDKSGECWLWTAGGDADGYGSFWIKGFSPVKPHRYAYEVFIGPIPPGLTVDHTCHNNDPECEGGITCTHRRCVNPDHLEAVPNLTNIMRSRFTPAAMNAAKTHCPKNHPYDEENTLHKPDGARGCAECGRVACRKYRARKKAEAVA